jgi:acetyl-CoA C-acetyltransferase
MSSHNQVVIVSAVRTPIGSFMGSLSTVPSTALGAAAIKGAIDKIGLDPNLVDEVFMGQVVQAGAGQGPARQAALLAGLPQHIPCTTINKVCSSGLKSVMLAAQSIALGDIEIAVAGGMESMSLIPHYTHLRQGVKFGSTNLVDGLQADGLTDSFDHEAMGVCADLCATEHQFTREDQDAYAEQSYRRSAKAWATGKFKDEVVPVSVPQKKGEPVLIEQDEEFERVDFSKLSSLKPAFSSNGTVTAANASTINDGAAALILMSVSKAQELNLTPLAKIISFADAATDPKHFTIAPSLALPKALSKGNLSISDLDFVELNEAFSVVALANMKELKLSPDRVNVNGGAVSLGHPLGCSGARILVTLIHVLKQNQGRYGAAGICNGGGGASAMVIER